MLERQDCVLQEWFLPPRAASWKQVHDPSQTSGSGEWLRLGPTTLYCFRFGKAGPRDHQRLRLKSQLEERHLDRPRRTAERSGAGHRQWRLGAQGGESVKMKGSGQPRRAPRGQGRLEGK